MQLYCGGIGDTRSAHAKRVAKCYGTTSVVYPRIVICDAKLAEAGKALRGKGFIELYNVYIVKCKACFCKRFLCSQYRAYTHDARFHTHYSRAYYAGFGGYIIF